MNLKMEANGKRESDAAVGAINYSALISAYRVIKEYKKTGPDAKGEAMKRRFEEWMNEEKYCREKQIAEMVVNEELLYYFCFGEEINRRVGFELVPSGEHL
jgi:hypothetical protein